MHSNLGIAREAFKTVYNQSATVFVLDNILVVRALVHEDCNGFTRFPLQFKVFLVTRKNFEYLANPIAFSEKLLVLSGPASNYSHQ
mmetsp:Transcript_25735/g.62499  ORF Transcript_25735/g.62499 Transcript_25735/m.62499 type:complete len:86 (-) Transcript_25735:136-393(-)